MTSLRRRILTSFALIQCAGALIATCLVVEHERRQAYRALDATLGEQAAAVRALLEAPEGVRTTIRFHKEFLTLPAGDRYLIIGPQNNVLGGSQGWYPGMEFSDASRSTADIEVMGRSYRALVLRHLAVVEPETNPSGPSPSVTIVYATLTEPVEKHIRRVQIDAVEACLVLLIVGAFLSSWALDVGLKPLLDLAHDAECIDVGHWTLPRLAASQRFVELKPLADALQGLVSRLSGAFERERQFFGDAAHELKSSVAIVRSTLQFALQSSRSTLEYEEELQNALHDTSRVQDLVRRMLDLARIESLRTAVEATEQDRSEAYSVCQRVVDSFTPLAVKAGVLIHFIPEQYDAWVAMKEEDLFNVLVNLIENSLAHVECGDVISIRIRYSAGDAELLVADTGCGIAEDARPHIFDRFYRGDRSRSRDTGGVGLGLSIVKALILRAGGTIEFAPGGQGGSIFRISLPLAHAPSIYPDV